MIEQLTTNQPFDLERALRCGQGHRWLKDEGDEGWHTAVFDSGHQWRWTGPCCSAPRAASHRTGAGLPRSPECRSLCLRPAFGDENLASGLGPTVPAQHPAPLLLSTYTWTPYRLELGREALLVGQAQGYSMEPVFGLSMEEAAASPEALVDNLVRASQAEGREARSRQRSTRTSPGDSGD